MSDEEFARTTIMFCQALNAESEILLLDDPSSTKHPDYIVHHDEAQDLKDPATFQEARSSKYWPRWLNAIYEEKESLVAKEVFEEVKDLPPSRRAIGSKFVFHIKRDEYGHIVRFKVRLVAQGFSQIPGQDFTFTFAPVARWDSLRILVATSLGRCR